MHDADLPVWRFTPVARPDDPAWQGRIIWQELEVAAPSSGAALLAAERRYEEITGATCAHSKDGQDLKLYRFDRIDSAASPCGDVSDGGSVSGRVSADVLDGMIYE